MYHSPHPQLTLVLFQTLGDGSTQPRSGGADQQDNRLALGEVEGLGRLCHPSSPGSCPATSRSAQPPPRAGEGCSSPPLPPAGGLLWARQPQPGQRDAMQTPSCRHSAPHFSPGGGEHQQKGRFAGLGSEPEAGPGGAALSHPLLLPTGHPPAWVLHPWAVPLHRVLLGSAQG